MSNTEMSRTRTNAGSTGVDDRFRAALDVLLHPDLEPLVEMVISSPAPHTYEARSIDGAVRFHRRPTPDGWIFAVDSVEGRDPLADQDPTRFSPLPAEVAAGHPHRRVNSYPYAWEHAAQIFDHPCAPDLCVLHTAAHQQEHHRGEHGSLGVVQARAPFILAGAGVRRLGMTDRHCRLIDVAPTLLALLGAEPGTGVRPGPHDAAGEPRPDAHLAHQDGDALIDILDMASGPPDHVVAVLLDGCNPNRLYDMAATGEAPHVARLLAMGTGFRHGAMASLPTVTLANHTSLLTGCHPGHHGVLHNAWYDRRLGRQVITESPATWQEAMQWLTPGVETIHQAIKRHRPEAVTVSVNEPADSGADYSTFELFRQGRTDELLPDFSVLPPFTTEPYAETSESYRWSSFADSVALRQATAIWAGHHLGVDYPPPVFMWVSFSLTDSAFHEGGPHGDIARASVRDTDARLGELLASIEAAGVFDQTAFCLVADHGMEENDPEVNGNWGDALRASGIRFRDEASGFLYFDVE
ncbi:MAG TPA: alkaline phosphatase family protein [Acidimicrobiales bacterium]|nr:alkaline phosphatase family protein [Acidimicrobiales bacterium]